MKTCQKSLEAKLKNNCNDFSESTKTNIERYLDAQFSNNQEVIQSDSIDREKDLHFSILFNGSVYGEFILSMDRELASRLIADDEGDFEANKEDIFDSFKEILNMSVGKTMENLGKNFDHLTITSPKITVGEMYLPKMPIFTKALKGDLGTISCSLYVDQMKLTIATEYSEKKERLDDAEREKEKLRVLNKAKTEFLANMSHELRTPLNGMIGNLDLLKNSKLDVIQRQRINTVSQSGDFLLGIINDILEFSKIESGKMEVEKRSFNLAEVVEQFADSIANQAFAKGLHFSVNIDPNIPSQIVSDETRLKQIMMNLVGNSLKFTPKGEVSLSLQRRDDQIIFSVKDSGVGIPKQKLETIFESFSQVDVSDNRKYGGSGLGLTISKAIVSALGGEIRVESEEAVGTTFSFAIPFVDQDEEAGRRRTSSVSESFCLVSCDSSLEESISFYKECYSSSASLMPSITSLLADLSDETNILVDWNVWSRTSSEDQLKLIQKAKENSLNLGFLLKPSHFLELESFTDKLDGLKGKIINLPMTSLKWKTFFNSGSKISFRKENDETKEGAPKELTGKVLLIEDNLVNQQIAKTMLESFGLTVDIANNGEEAVALASDSKYDLVFMDCQMPVMDGYEATKRIRQDLESVNHKTKIVALTANAFREIKERCFECGMNDFATKPVKLESLKKIIDEHIGERESA